MALGIGLLMPPGADGRPDAVYLVDMNVVCGACGKDGMRRYFLSTSFHSLTLRRLNHLFDAVPGVVEGACEQCEQEYALEDVVNWSLQYSPGDGEGLLVGLAERSGRRSWRAVPHGHLDVQMQPVFEWDDNDISSTVMPSLDETQFYACFRRHLNPKSALRQAILALHDRSHPAPASGEFTEGGACIVTASAGLELWIGDAGAQQQALLEHPQKHTYAILVEDGRIADGYPDAPMRWLSDLAPQLGGRSVIAFTDRGAADASLRRHFSRFPVDLTFEDDGRVLRVIAGDGSDEQAVLEFSPTDIALEAARTGAAPGDIARVEIDRALTLLDFTTP